MLQPPEERLVRGTACSEQKLNRGCDGEFARYFGFESVDEMRAEVTMVARRWARSDVDPDDVIQTVMLKAFLLFRRNEDVIRNGKAWLHSVTHYTILAGFRRAMGRVDYETNTDTLETVADIRAQAAEQAILSDMSVENILRSLPPADQHLLRLELHGASTEEIAAQLRVSEAVVRKRRQRMRQRLHQHLEGLEDLEDLEDRS